MTQQHGGYVSIDGATIRGTNVFIGGTVRATVHSTVESLDHRGMRAVGEKLDAVLRALSEDPTAVSEVQAGEILQAVAIEVDKPQPDRPRIERLLKSLAAMVGEATGVATAIQGLLSVLHVIG